MELNSVSISLPSAFSVEVKVLESDEVALVAVGDWLSSVVSAVCAALMSLLDSAESTLEMKVPSGSVPGVLFGESCSTWVRYFFALVVSPDLMADIRLERAESKLFVLVDDDDEVEVVEVVVSCEKSDEFCKPEIFIDPTHLA